MQTLKEKKKMEIFQIAKEFEGIVDVTKNSRP